jgi:hypothetical protein
VTPPKNQSLPLHPKNIFHSERWRIAGDDNARPRAEKIRKQAREIRIRTPIGQRRA